MLHLLNSDSTKKEDLKKKELQRDKLSCGKFHQVCLCPKYLGFKKHNS